MKRIFSFFALVLAVAFFVCLVSLPSAESGEEFPPPYPEVSRITQGQCLSLFKNKRNPPILLDVRLQKQWEQSKNKLPGAVHEDPSKVKEWAGKYDKNRTIITY